MKLVSAVTALVVLVLSSITPSLANGTVRRAKADKDSLCTNFFNLDDILESLQQDSKSEVGGTVAGFGDGAIASSASSSEVEVGPDLAATFLIHVAKTAIATQVEFGILSPPDGQGISGGLYETLVYWKEPSYPGERKDLLASAPEINLNQDQFIDKFELFRANLNLPPTMIDSFLLSLGGYF